MLTNDAGIAEMTASLMKRAEEKFGKERAHELLPAIEQMAAQLVTLNANPLEYEDEP